jgi:PAS domain S-box-containing protein
MTSGTSHAASADFFRLVADSIPLLVWISGVDKRCTYFNKPWLDFTGRPIEDELGDGWADGVHADDLQHCLDTYTRAFDQRDAFTMEYRLRRHDGEFRWVLDKGTALFNPDGSFAGMLGIAVDITERKDVEESLRRKERELQETQRLAGVGGWQWDAASDTVTWSEELYRITGRDPTLPAVPYTDHGQLYTRESREQLQRARDTTLRTGAPYRLDVEMIRADGTRRWITTRGEAQRDSAGGITGLRGTLQDITERKLAEDAVSSVNRRLIEAQEAERARIARDLHDDIGQRLALLAMTLDHVTGLQPDPASEASTSLKALQKQTVDIMAAVQALSHELHSSRLLHLGVAAAMRGFCGEVSGQNNVEIEFAHRDVPASVPPEVSLCLFRVLQEALHNAVRHSRVHHVEVQLRGTGTALALTVCDHGVGFDVDAASRGLGLGLTSMKERLKLIGGELLIESQSKRGTTVLARAPVRPS